MSTDIKILSTDQDLAIAFWERKPIAVYLNGRLVDSAERIQHLNNDVVTLGDDRVYLRTVFEFCLM